MTNKLTPVEQTVYNDLNRGMCHGDIARKLRLPIGDIIEIRYILLKKGYSVPDGVPHPGAEEQAETEPERKKDPRGRRWTPEQKEEIMRYSTDHTDRETIERYGLSRYTLWKWKTAARNAAQKPQDAPATAEGRTVAETPQSVPADVLNALGAAQAENDTLRAMIQEVIPAEVVQAVLDRAEALRAEADRHEEEARVYRRNAEELETWAQKVLDCVASKTQKQEGDA